MPITAQDLIDAATDAETLGAFANGSGMVTPREGAPYTSLRQFLIDNQTEIDDAFVAAGAQLQYIGRVALLYRDGAATANSLSTVTISGAAAAYKNTDLYICSMVTSNTSSSVVLSVDGLAPKPVLTNTGDPLPVPAWGVGSHVSFRYRADTDSFLMAGSDWTLPANWMPTSPGPSHLVATAAESDGGDPKQLKLTPRSPLVNDTGFDQYFFVKFPDDRPDDVGMLAKVVGVNDAEYVGLLDVDGVSAVPNGAWLAGDTGIIARETVSPFRFYLVSVFQRVAAVVPDPTITTYDARREFYTVRNIQIASS